jgi:tRNA threonylcarbamoyladenosine biosynthesis protein TsaB
LNEGLSHAEKLHLFIEKALAEANIQLNQLNAISLSKGPGSYTGLRIGSSAAKGLAFALNIPLIAIDTLKALTASVLQNDTTNVLFCPMFDARRNEVYTAVYTNQLELTQPVQALIVNEESITIFNSNSSIIFFGDGMSKCKVLLSTLKNAQFKEGVFPSAINQVKLALNKYLNKQFEDLAYFEPYYLKEFYTTAQKR